MLLTILFCSLPVLQDYCLITKCMTEPQMETMITRLEAVDQMYSSIRDQPIVLV